MLETEEEPHGLALFPLNCQEVASTHLEIDGNIAERGLRALDFKRSFRWVTHRYSRLPAFLGVHPARFREMVNYSFC